MNFGHNPDPAIDFACEVDCIEAEVIDRAAGMAPTMNDLGARIERAMQFKAGGSTNAIAAKHDLRKIEAAFKAGAAAPAPQEQPATAPDLRAAAQAVLDRWNSPRWEWAKQGPTGDLMADLRRALDGVNASDEAAKLIEQRKRLGWSDERIGAELAYRGLPTPGVPVVDKPSMTPEQWDSEVARLTAIKDDPRKEYGRRCEASTALVRLLTAGRPSGVKEDGK